MAIRRYAHNLSHNVTGTVNMGLNYPVDIMEVFPGDSFRITAKNLSRFMPQVAPTTSDVFAGFDFYDVPLRQLCELVGINWDKYLTGGQNGTDMIQAPTITIPKGGYEPGSLADWLGYPTNYLNPDFDSSQLESDENPRKILNGEGLVLDAWPVIAYMHVIDSNYLDQNFIQHLDFTKYQEFLDGTYEFKDAQGNPIDYDILVDGIFPKAWSRDYFGRAMPNTQRGPVVTLPIGDTADLTPTSVPVLSSGSGYCQCVTGGRIQVSEPLVGNYYYDFVEGSYYPVGVANAFIFDKTAGGAVDEGHVYWSLDQNGTLVFSGDDDLVSGVQTNGVTFTAEVQSGKVDLTGVKADLAAATGISMLVFRTFARMQRFGEVLQQAGARAVEYTMAFFGVRVPDGRAQRPIFHGSFNMPVVFSEVLQTSQTTDTSPQAYMAGHGITGGVNRPIHIKCIEHGFIVVIGHFMPRSQYQQYIPKYLLRFNRMDIPNPLFQHIGEQAVLRKEIYPNSAKPDETFGYVPRYTELTTIPSVLRGHMKDTFLHWSMARTYGMTEPVLSAAWRYEKPSNRSFSVPDEDQIVMSVGFEINARRVFKRNPSPGIHIV